MPADPAKIKLGEHATLEDLEREREKMNVNIHSLCTWKDIINYIEDENIFSDLEISNLKEFLLDPNKWREKNG